MTELLTCSFGHSTRPDWPDAYVLSHLRFMCWKLGHSKMSDASYAGVNVVMLTFAAVRDVYNPEAQSNFISGNQVFSSTQKDSLPKMNQKTYERKLKRAFVSMNKSNQKKPCLKCTTQNALKR